MPSLWHPAVPCRCVLWNRPQGEDREGGMGAVGGHPVLTLSLHSWGMCGMCPRELGPLGTASSSLTSNTH